MPNLFSIVLNTDTTLHAFLDRSGNPFLVPSKAAFDHPIAHNAKRSYLQPISNFLSFVKDKEQFYLQRSFALGDVLQTVPVMRYLNSLDHNCYLRTSSLYIDVLQKIGINAQRIRSNNKDYGIILDGTVERDHEEPRLQAYHRIDQYLSAIGVKEENIVFDWSCDLSKFASVKGDFVEKPYIVLQGRGSGPRKSLPDETIDSIIKLLNADNIRVAVVGGSEGIIAQKNYDSEMTHIFFKQLNLEQLFWLISRAQCAVCVDSSVNWISHFTSTPVIAILGSTRAEQRTIYHPLYSEGACAIELWKEIECEPCFESAKDCSGKYSCLALSPDKIYELIKPHIRKFINGN